MGDNVPKPPEHISLAEAGAGGESATTAIRKPRRVAKGKGKGHRADQFCVYRTSDGANVPVMAIEYKAPHKLSQGIQPERDIINKDGGGFEFAAKALSAAVVTQLFSYMVGKGIQYGYICTGQAFVFLRIPNDPATLYYYVCVPRQDFLGDDENRLHRTAAAQVFAFVVQALRATPPPLSWHDAAAAHATWDVEYDDILSKIPASVRKNKEPRTSPYKPQRWRGFRRLPIRTRSRCRRPSADPSARDDDKEDDKEGNPPSSTPRSGRQATGSGAGARQGQRGRERRQQYGQQQGGQRGRPTPKWIHDRLYCTHRCLSGLASGQPIDETCPNASRHGPRHIGRIEFLHLLRSQLASDRGPNADSTPLYLSGSVGSLFKIRLSTYGYTLVAKGVEVANLARLQHEDEVYKRIRTLQGKYVPVCLGSLGLALPHYCNGGVFEHFLLLSWAGQRAYTELHRLRVLHGDAEPRNLLYNASNRTLMVADFERAELRDRPALGLISPNSQSQKRKRGAAQKQGSDDSTRELQSVVESVSSCSVTAKTVTLRRPGGASSA